MTDHPEQHHELPAPDGAPDSNPSSPTDRCGTAPADGRAPFDPPGTEIEPVPAASVADRHAIEALTRRTNLMIGVLATLLVGAFIVIGLLFGRVASAENDAQAARDELATVMSEGGVSSEELTSIRDDLDRVEAGAALYASQIDGFREQLVELSPQIEAGVDEAITGLREFSDSTIAFDVPIDEVIPIDTEVVINRTVEVPIRTEIPINQDIDTTVQVDTPFGNLPLDITVPVDVVVPIDLTVDIPIDETVPVQDEFPVDLDVPIEIDVGDTELKNLTDSLATGLESLQDVLTGLGE